VRSTADGKVQAKKKPLEKTPGEKPIALWATSAPNGAGVLSNGYRFVGISPPTTAMYHHISTNVNTHQKNIWMLLDVAGLAEALLPQPLAVNSKSSGKEKPQRS
jgi:hypothetical protein